MKRLGVSTHHSNNTGEPRAGPTADFELQGFQFDESRNPRTIGSSTEIPLQGEFMTTLDMSAFRRTPTSGAIGTKDATGAAPIANPLGPLALLPGTWKGRGFNQIWRPFFGGPPGQDRFLELNETAEVLQFVEIPGDIPNRGLLQADIALHGCTYLQKVNDAHVLNSGKPAGIHIEPGIWVSVPNTTNPNDPATVARLANIPHGTSLVAQGKAITVGTGPTINPVDITPFTIG